MFRTASEALSSWDRGVVTFFQRGSIQVQGSRENPALFSLNPEGRNFVFFQ